MIEPVEIINRFTEYSPSKGEEPLPLPIPGHWFRKICALAERIARAENERDTLRARVAELEADRDSESRWAKEYLARAERAEADAERLAEALMNIEWIEEDMKSSRYWMCPHCRMMKIQGHSHDCIRQVALAAHDAAKDGQP
jgi:predicted RNase H-like nuclease (RuvC/YqgF family)